MPAITPTLRGDDEVDAIPPALINGVGVVALVVALYWMLAKEHLVVGAAHRRELAAKDMQIAALEKAHEQRAGDKDAQIVMWRAVGETAQAQMVELLEHSRLTVQLLQAIEKRGQENAAKQPGV